MYLNSNNVKISKTAIIHKDVVIEDYVTIGKKFNSRCWFSCNKRCSTE